MRIRKKDCGLVFPEHLCLAAPSYLASADVTDIPYTTEWCHHIIPTYDQGALGSCVGHATSNWIEAMVRKHVGRDSFQPGEQINSEAVYARGREMFWRGQGLDGGLYLHQGFYAAIDLGLLPPETKVETVPMDFKSVARALVDQPLVMGQMIDRGWYKADTNSGYITNAPGRLGGHAILMIGVTRQKLMNYVILQNSWGRNWGWHGNGMMDQKNYLERQYVNCVYAKLPKGWIKHGGWKNFIKKV